ncbi:MAG: FtsX-like permease family protein [Planctomycetes bacterium]|nr:FtsX-like permease family protein [Planctomycetota bacterium]
MFAFHLKLALASIRRTPWTTLLAVLTIGLGVGAATSMTGIYHIFSGDPLPQKSAVIFNVRIDTWDPDSQFFGVDEGDPPKAVTYQDMTGLMKSDIPLHQTGVADGRLYVFPDDGKNETYQTVVQLCHAEFFPMFDVPLRLGSGWTREMERRQDAVCVISQPANDKLFGGSDSVGRKIRLGSRDFTIVGVLERWRPTPKYYDVVNNFVGEPNDFFVPFDFIREEDLGLSISGNTDGWGDDATFRGDRLFTVAEYYWIQFWVELAPGRRAEYVAFVDAYCNELKALGRHPRPLNSRVQPLLAWVDQRNNGASIAAAIAVISQLFLLICSINLLGLLLGKFLARAPRIGVHRALGASRAAIFLQHVIECELIGALGSLIGIGLAVVGLRLVNLAMPSGAIPDDLFVLDGFMVALAIGLSLAAGLVAGVYPAWRACRTVPAVQINLR